MAGRREKQRNPQIFANLNGSLTMWWAKFACYSRVLQVVIASTLMKWGCLTMLNDLPLMSFIRKKMQWHQSRSSVLASNVANADTPGYKPSDLKALDFQSHIDSSHRAQAGMRRTHANHLGGGALIDQFESAKVKDFEVTPSGNGVVLEDQMMKVAENQFDYQLATTVYSRSLGLLKMAIGRG